MRIYYSGAHTELTGTPERCLKTCNVMTTFYDIWKAKDKLPERFDLLFQHHKESKEWRSGNKTLNLIR